MFYLTALAQMLALSLPVGLVGFVVGWTMARGEAPWTSLRAGRRR